MNLYVGNDHILLLEGLKDTLTDTFINDATVTATLRKAIGSTVSGQSWPTTMDYVASSDGNYQAILDDSLDIHSGLTYVLEISVDAGSDSKAFFREEIVASYRE